MDRARAADLTAFAHTGAPFDRIVEAVGPPREPGRHPLFQVMLNHRSGARPALRLAGLRATELPQHRSVAKYPSCGTSPRRPTARSTAAWSTPPTASNAAPPRPCSTPYATSWKPPSTGRRRRSPASPAHAPAPDLPTPRLPPPYLPRPRPSRRNGPVRRPPRNSCAP
ncbi:hypothetical protein ACFQVA_38875 [Actinomadura keratinilytica]